jgi:sugar-phosphatase
MINTVLFDMDGLLLDTESLWGLSMWAVADKHNIRIAPDRFAETTGLRIHQVTEHWARHYPWQGADANAVAEEILDDIIERAKTHGRIMPGVEKLLTQLEDAGFRIGLASSSPSRMIEALLRHYILWDRFRSVVSAEGLEWGKPHPAVFLKCAEELEAKPFECLVLEDSVNGCIAGKAALMKVVAVVEERFWEDPRFAIADLKIRSLEDLRLEKIGLM